MLAMWLDCQDSELLAAAQSGEGAEEGTTVLLRSHKGFCKTFVHLPALLLKTYQPVRKYRGESPGSKAS